MPNLNLKGTNAPLAPGGIRPGVRPAVDQANKGIQPVLYVVGGVVVLAVLVFVLNATHVVHLWGKKAAPPVAAQVQPAVTAPLTAPPAETQALSEPGKEQAAATSSTKKSERPAWNSSGYASSSIPKIPTAGGKYSVQVSSWTTEQKARIQADVLTRAGFPAFVQKASVKGKGNYYRVYIGRYPSSVAAKSSAEKFAQMLESRYWVVRLEN
jgi:cell division septation protein DedD